MCLLGNGASAAYNSDLRVEALTEALLVKLQTESGTTEAAETLGRFANMISGNAGRQFESLLGPLSTTAEAVVDLQEIASLVEHALEAREAIARTSGFLVEVHRRGVAVALKHVAEKTIGQAGQWDAVIDSLGQALAGLGQANDLTVATLSYDGLTHSALLNAWNDAWGQPPGKIADLAEGWGDTPHEVVPGQALTGRRLRRDHGVPSDRALLLQLHGSLGWLRRGSESAWKFQLTDLRVQ